MASFEGGMDLWVSDLRSRSTKVMHKLNSGWASLEMDKDGKDLFLLGGRSMQKISLGSERRSPITYSAEMKLDQAAERAYMFDQGASSGGQTFLREEYAWSGLGKNDQGLREVFTLY